MEQATVGYQRGVDLTPYVSRFCLFVWGMGQLVPLDWWYLHGITLGDLVFIAYLGIRGYTSASLRNQLVALARDNKPYVVSIAALIATLLFSILVNSGAYSVSPFYVFSVLRSVYFLLVTLLVTSWVLEDSPAALCKSYLAGLLVAEIWMYVLAFHPDSGVSVLCGYPIMLNPNVAGNMLGVGIIFSTLLVLQGQFLLPFVVSTGLAYLSIFSFSKGTWGMVFFGMLALIFAVIYKLKTMAPHRRRRAAKHFAVFVTALSILVFVDSSKISCMVETKLITQAVNGSIETRLTYLQEAIFFGSSNFFGVGVGGFGDRSKVETQDSYGFVGYSSHGNPHSAFLHILASGGVVSLLLFLFFLVYPLWKLRTVVPRSRYFDLYLVCTFLTFVVSGSFQLQLFSQYFFPIFAGIVMALVIRQRQVASIHFSRPVAANGH